MGAGAFIPFLMTKLVKKCGRTATPLSSSSTALSNDSRVWLKTFMFSNLMLSELRTMMAYVFGSTVRETRYI